MGITSSKKKTKKLLASQENDADCQISTIEEVEEQSIPDIEDNEDKISNLEEKIEEISEIVPELIVEVNTLPELTTISKLPNDINELPSFVKSDDIMSLKNEISAMKEERDSLRTSFTEEFRSKLAEIHNHLQKRLDFLQQEVETNVKAKYEASLKSYEVQVNILEKKNKILQNLLVCIFWVRKTFFSLFFSFENIKTRYDNRESKPEDIAKISELEEKVALQKDKIKNLYQGLTSYKKGQFDNTSSGSSKKIKKKKNNG